MARIVVKDIRSLIYNEEKLKILYNVFNVSILTREENNEATYIVN